MGFIERSVDGFHLQRYPALDLGARWIRDESPLDMNATTISRDVPSILLRSGNVIAVQRASPKEVTQEISHLLLIHWRNLRLYSKRHQGCFLLSSPENLRGPRWVHSSDVRCSVLSTTCSLGVTSEAFSDPRKSASSIIYNFLTRLRPPQGWTDAEAMSSVEWLQDTSTQAVLKDSLRGPNFSSIRTRSVTFASSGRSSTGRPIRR